MVVVTVEMDYSGALTNQVQVTTEEGATGIYTTTSQAQVTPALEVTKQASSATVPAGERLTFILCITNTGNVDLHATITDTPPAHVAPTGVLVWTTTMTAPGGVWIQLVIVTVTRGYSGTLTNRVQVTSDEGAAGEAQVTVSAMDGYQVYLPLILK